MADPTHEPVMAEEVLELLPLRPGGLAVDGTIGLAGHGLRIAEKLAPGGLFVGLDWDETMLRIAEERLAGVKDVEKELFHTDYRGLPDALRKAAQAHGRKPLADAILLDLGLNSAQIEDPSRGISFNYEGPLDMRMDRSTGEPASALLNRLSVHEIERMLKQYGDENWAKRIAQVIVDRRKIQPLRTTGDLVDCVLAAVPPAMRDKRIHPATRTFQAVRIAVNGELEGLDETFEEIALQLAQGGVLAVLAYHSGEDRAAKHAFRRLQQRGFEELFRRPRTPSENEIQRNPKSRSAKLRALRRIEENHL